MHVVMHISLSLDRKPKPRWHACAELLQSLTTTASSCQPSHAEGILNDPRLSRSI